MEDSPVGVRDTDYASVFPSGMNVAMTWDTDLMYQRGVAMGQEFRGKGVNVALGPMVRINLLLSSLLVLIIPVLTTKLLVLCR